MASPCVVQPPVALYDFPTGARNEFKRLVSGKENYTIREPELEKRVFALDSVRFDPPCAFIMRDFANHKRYSDEWLSKPFYTHPQGYKMCLSVYANGLGRGAKGSHVSVFFRLMWGEFDYQLKWPFRRTITVEVSDQSGGRWNHAKKIFFNDDTPADIAGQVLSGEMNRRRWGEPKFIAQASLSRYLRDDCLEFKVTL